MDESIINKTYSILKQDEIRNLSITGFMENNPVINMWQAGDSYAVKGKNDNEWIYFSSEDEFEFEDLLFLIKEENCFGYGSLYPWMIPLIKDYQEKEPEWILSTNNYYLPDSVSLSLNKIETRKLFPEDAEYILQHSDYKQFLNVDYLKDRINRSYSAGIEVKGKLAAWGLTHDDGALGSLHVLKNYRRKGFAKEITISLVEQCRRNGKIPFAQIEENNKASISLLQKLGFVKDREVMWMKIKII